MLNHHNGGECENRLRRQATSKDPMGILLWGLFIMSATVLYLDNPGNGRQFHSEETDKMDREYAPDEDQDSSCDDPDPPLGYVEDFEDVG